MIRPNVVQTHFNLTKSENKLAEVVLTVLASYERPERLRKDRRSLKATVGSISSSSLSSSFGVFPRPGSLITGFIFSQGTTVMAPIRQDLFGLAISQQPEAVFLSIIVLFIICIALLVLCASCRKHSFELESSSAPEQKSSTLVSVARKDDSGARSNPAANEITGDEMESDVTVSHEGIVYKPWRSHTLSRDSNLPTQINGGVGKTTEGI